MDHFYEHLRMCTTHHRSCEGCPIDANRDENCTDWMAANHLQAKRLIEEWVKQNPEPVFPTWLEWLEGLLPKTIPAHISNISISLDDTRSLWRCGGQMRMYVDGEWSASFSLNDRIPADIALLLGVETRIVKADEQEATP